MPLLQKRSFAVIRLLACLTVLHLGYSAEASKKSAQELLAKTHLSDYRNWQHLDSAIERNDKAQLGLFIEAYGDTEDLRDICDYSNIKAHCENSLFRLKHNFLMSKENIDLLVEVMRKDSGSAKELSAIWLKEGYRRKGGCSQVLTELLLSSDDHVDSEDFQNSFLMVNAWDPASVQCFKHDKSVVEKRPKFILPYYRSLVDSIRYIFNDPNGFSDHVKAVFLMVEQIRYLKANKGHSGIYIDQQKKVVETPENSPAALLEIPIGSQILRVDDKSVETLTAHEVVALLMGDLGKSISLTYQHLDLDREVNVTIALEPIDLRVGDLERVLERASEFKDNQYFRHSSDVIGHLNEIQSASKRQCESSQQIDICRFAKEQESLSAQVQELLSAYREGIDLIRTTITEQIARAEREEQQERLRTHKKQNTAGEWERELCRVVKLEGDVKRLVEKERAIGRKSGSYNMTALNDLGRELVNLKEEQDGLAKEFRRKFKKPFQYKVCK